MHRDVGHGFWRNDQSNRSRLAPLPQSLPKFTLSIHNFLRQVSAVLSALAVFPV